MISFGEKHPLDRRWRWWPCVGYDKMYSRIRIGLEKQLLQWKGKRLDKPRPGRSFYFDITLNPKNWKLRQEHLYYDTQHCFYDFGPFTFGSVGSPKLCQKCLPPG